MHDMEQLVFSFALPAYDLVCMADKVMSIKGSGTGIKVHRITAFNLWVITEMVPIWGPSGRVGAAIFYVHQKVFFSGREARRYAQGSITPFLG